MLKLNLSNTTKKWIWWATLGLSILGLFLHSGLFSFAFFLGVYTLTLCLKLRQPQLLVHRYEK